MDRLYLFLDKINWTNIIINVIILLVLFMIGLAIVANVTIDMKE